MDADTANKKKTSKARSYTQEEKDAISPRTEWWHDGNGNGTFQYTRKNLNNGNVTYQCSYRRFGCKSFLSFPRTPIDEDENPLGKYDRDKGKVNGLHTRSCVVYNGLDPDAVPWEGKLEENPFFQMDDLEESLESAGETTCLLSLFACPI
jgi:hypothetical protein